MRLSINKLATPFITASDTVFEELKSIPLLQARKNCFQQIENNFSVFRLVVLCYTDRIDSVNAPTKQSGFFKIAAFILRRYILARSASINNTIINQFFAWTFYIVSLSNGSSTSSIQSGEWYDSNILSRLDSIRPDSFCHLEQVAIKNFNFRSL